jgi:hypothetical protein
MGSNQMTDEQINQKIAEACGWNRIQGNRGMPPDHFQSCFGDAPLIPHYTEDLNAMHKVEKTLQPNQKSTYEAHLLFNIERDQTELWHATALQRAEAFLRTHKLWQK